MQCSVRLLVVEVDGRYEVGLGRKGNGVGRERKGNGKVQRRGEIKYVNAVHAINDHLYPWSMVIKHLWNHVMSSY